MYSVTGSIYVGFIVYLLETVNEIRSKTYKAFS